MKFAVTSLAMLGLMGCSIPAAAQSLTRDLSDQAQTLVPTSSAPELKPLPVLDTGPPAAPNSKPDLVIAPIPVSNPAMGTGLAGAAVLFYNPNQARQPWISGIGGGYTSTDSWAAGVFHSMSLDNNRLRFLGFAGYGVANVDFYGIGPDAGAAGLSVKMHDTGFAAIVDTEYQIFRKGFLRHLYFGARLYYLDLNARTKIPLPNHPELTPPEFERDSAVSMIGPAFTFDTRDNSTYPRKGVYATGSLLYGADWLGSDFEHRKFQFAGNAYFPLGQSTVLGIRKQLCSVTKSDAPYYDLCLYGQQGDLRGYETGRYRDGASWALQAEVRQHLFGRFGMVGFGGLGGIAKDAGDIFKHSKMLPAAGVGLRFLASKSANVNLRADVAWGKDGAAFYFGIGEAF